MSDNGSAFTSADFKAHLASQGQSLRHSGAGLHHQNGRVERSIHTIMDSIVLDAGSRQSLYPLKMTLGIFNVATRTSRVDAWETLYFHPSKEHESAKVVKKTKSFDNIQNLHNGLRVALKSFRNLCKSGKTVEWRNLPYAGKNWHVHMKFAIAYVIGDTDLHDQLCGRYGSYSLKTAHLCRHCDCPTLESVNPRYQTQCNLWEPNHFSSNVKPDVFKKRSHHPIHNAFHDLDFGCNPHNIHLASPGECLHMHQLGCAKRAVEYFKEFATKNGLQPYNKLSLLTQR